MISSGETAVTTSGDTAVTLLAASVLVHHNVTIVNGNVAGFFSVDGGTTWCRLPASTTVTLLGMNLRNAAVKVKRIASGSNLADVYGYAW